ncbi:hypothetical protein LPJ38_26780 [Bradyrhizobium daqingense]|uniref:Uncharacterized protein n=1 Tax=Bradyrhizobium daqingense TaxID=993502 RepID=A0A562LMP5_9BRAD|nr:hypothetical protein [Bradyrhizobium daqingense]TWI08856.1 hypothetical protein IQ17_01680 [Bradyrhizobium daqingense]UFS87234.1 hypothetical protein LPJ38_26780 [Bradyrhizobium daqingense]
MNVQRPQQVETLLDEVEAITADILARPECVDADIDGVAAWASETCHELRQTLAQGDAAAAAYIGYRLGERLGALRELGEMARRAALYKSPTDKAHERDAERRKAYWTEIDRGFSDAKAVKRAAEKLKISAKSIRRAILGH